MPLTVIRASAGSGKTYQLAVSFIRILLEGEIESEPRNPAAILATTFTRAAAGEILDRVLRLLAEAVLADERRKYLAGQLGLPLSPEHCRQILASLAHGIDRLAISTMDAFFAQIGRAFAGRLGLAPDWRMAVDEAEADLLRRTIHAILDAMDLDSLMAALWTYRTGIVSSAQGELADLAGTLNRINGGDSRAGPFQRAAARRWAREEIAGAIEVIEGNDAWIPKTGKGQPSKQWLRPLGDVRQALTPGNDVTALLTIPFVETVFEDGEYYDKRVPSVLRAALMPLLAIACEELRARYRARAAALKWLACHYQEWRRRTAFGTGGYTFDDVASMVAGTTVEGGELYFRLGTRFEHVLFDEFQDTSRLQFTFFRPMLEEIGASGGEVLVVGDEKQAIYGWRGGDRELMHGPLDELGGRIGATGGRRLSQSFRSSPAVLEAVNRVFLKLRGEWMDRGNRRCAVFEQAGAEWSADFASHEPAANVAELRGAVRILHAAAPDEEDEDRDGPLVSKVIELVGGHLAQDPNRKVGVLLRKRNLMPRIIAGIRRSHPRVDVSGEGGNPLTDSRAVELILGLLTCIEHPGHTAARFLVLTSPAAAAFGFPAHVRPGGAPRPDEWRVFRALRRGLMDRGFAGMLREWIRHPAFASLCSEHDALRCGQLIEVAREFDLRDAPGPGEFVEHVRARRIERPGGPGVRVMTIHAAKGLEFEAVLLLELDARQGRSGEPGISETDGGIEIVPSARDAVFLGATELVEAGARRDFMEELSVLYVGMTRACSFLDIVLRENSRAPLAHLLRSALPVDSQNVATQFEGVPGRSRDGAGIRAAPPESDPGIAPMPFGAAARAAMSGFKCRTTHATPSGREEGGLVSVAGILAPANRAAMRRGEMIHAWLAQIAWMEGGLPGVETLLAATADIAGELPRRQIEDRARRLLEEARSEGTELHAALSRPAPGDAAGLELWRERRFAVLHEPAGVPELLSGSFDRVILWRDAAGKAIRARIIDFKTDRFTTPEDRAGIEVRYAPQLAAYKKALCLLCPGLHEGAVSASLAFVRAGDDAGAR